jgi:hypothetical protein
VHLVVRSLTLASLAALGARVFAEDITTTATPDNQDIVLVDGFGIQPLYHLASPDGALILHPKALVGFGYDSNVYATDTDVKGSTFYDLVAGLDLKWVTNPEDTFVLSGEFEGERYVSQQGRNLSGGKAEFSYRHQASEWDAGGNASFARTNDPFVVTGQEIKHDDGHVGIDGTDHWAHQSVGLGATVDRLRYLEGAPGIFGKDDRNNTDVGLNARVGNEVGDQSEVYFRAQVDRRNYDQKTFSEAIDIPGTGVVTTHGYNDSTGITAVIGLKDKIATRTGVIAEVGVDYRKYADYFAGDADFNDKTVVRPAVNLVYRWSFEEGSWLGARAFSDVEDSVFSNAAWMYGVSVDARYRLSDEYKAAVFGSLSGYQLKDSGSPKTAQEPDDETRTTGEVNVGVEYVFHPGLGVRLKDVYDDSHSKYFNSFRRNLIEAQLGVVF